GAMSTGELLASNIACRKSSAMPIEARAMNDAVAGATMTISARSATVMWSSAVPGSQSELCTGLRVTASNVGTPMNRVAPCESTTSTFAPRTVSSRARWTLLYAAIPPVTPRTTWRPRHISGLGASPAQLAEGQVAAGQLLERQGRELLDPLGALELADGLARKLVQVAGEPGRNQDAAVLR